MRTFFSIVGYRRQHPTKLIDEYSTLEEAKEAASKKLTDQRKPYDYCMITVNTVSEILKCERTAPPVQFTDLQRNEDWRENPTLNPSVAKQIVEDFKEDSPVPNPDDPYRFPNFTRSGYGNVD